MGGGGGGWNAHLLKNHGRGGQDEKIGGLHEKKIIGWGGLKLWAFHPPPPPPPRVFLNGIAPTLYTPFFLGGGVNNKLYFQSGFVGRENKRSCILL